MTSIGLEIGVQLPATDGFGTGEITLVAAAQAAEQAGFDSVWVGDHFSFNVPVIESVVAATAAACSTTRVGIGFGVLLPALRHPGWLAKQLSSLQAMSRDRVVLGVGVGGEFPAEWQALGVPVSERGRRTDAFLDAVPDLLSGRAAAIGDPWNLHIPPLLPCGGVPPLWIGGRSDAALRRAVRYRAGWLAIWLTESELQARMQQLAALASAASVAPPPVGYVALVHVGDRVDTAHAAMAEYMQAIYRIPYERLRPYAMAGPSEALLPRLRRLAELGLQQLILIPAHRDPLVAIDALGEVARLIKDDPFLQERVPVRTHD